MSGPFPHIEPYESGMLDGGMGIRSTGSVAGTLPAGPRCTCTVVPVQAARQINGGFLILTSTVPYCSINAGQGAADR
jgi:hypothetical protein